MTKKLESLGNILNARGKMSEDILIRFSDFVVNAPYTMVIKDLEKNEFYLEAFLKFDVFIPMEKGIRPFQVIFPKYRFKKAYLQWTVRAREKAGRCNVFMEVYKLKKGNIRITKLYALGEVP